jgi:hypothetical protein
MLTLQRLVNNGKLSKGVFPNTLAKQIPYYNQEENSDGALASLIIGDPTQLQQLGVLVEPYYCLR